MGHQGSPFSPSRRLTGGEFIAIHDGEVMLRQRWSTGVFGFVAMLGLSVVIWGMLAALIGVVLDENTTTIHGDEVTLVPGTRSMWLAAIPASWIALVHLVNSTRIVIHRGWLSVTQGPLPWPGRKIDVRRAEVRDIRLVEPTQRIHPRHRREGHPPIPVNIVATLVSGQEITLMHGVPPAEARQALADMNAAVKDIGASP